MAVDRRVRKILKITGVVVLAIPVLLLVTTGILLSYARSDAGRERLRLFVLEKAHAAIPGLHIGRIGGDYLHDLIVSDVTIRDRAGRVAVQIDRIHARFSLVPLVRKKLFVRELVVEGPRVLGRHDDDGVLNLSQLTVPTAPDKKAQARPESPIGIQVDRLIVTRARADIETATGESVLVDSLELRGNLAWRGEELRLALSPLTASARIEERPYRLALDSRAIVSPREIHAVLERLVLGGVAPAGDVLVRAQVGGPLQAVGFRLDLGLPGAGGAVRGHGQVGLLASGGLGNYALQLEATDIDPQVTVPTAPPGKLSLTISGRGTGTPLSPGSRSAFSVTMPPSVVASLRILEARVDAATEGETWQLTRAFLRGAGAELTARGQGQGKQLQAHLRASIGDPADGRLPAPDFRGQGLLTADLRGTLPEDLTFEAVASARRVAVGNARLGSLALKVNGAVEAAERLSIAAHARLDNIRAGTVTARNALVQANVAGTMRAPKGQVRLVSNGVRPGSEMPPLDRVLLALNSDGKNLRLHGALAGPGASGGLTARGVLGPREARVTLDRLALDLRGPRLKQAVTLQKPVQIHWRAEDVLELGEMKIKASGAKLSGDFQLAGMYRLDRRGRLEPRATASVSLRRAVLGGLDSIDADGWFKLARTRLEGQLDAKVAGKADLHASAALPLVPGRNGAAPRLAKDGPLDVRVKTNQIKIQEIPLLYKQLARYGWSGGTVNLTASVSGDVAHPDATVAFDLRDVELRKVTGDGRDSVVRRLPGVGAAINIDTQRDKVRASGQVLLYRAGFVKFDSTLEADLGAILAGADPLKAPLQVQVDVPKFQIASLKGYFDQLRDTEGILAGEVTVRGTLARPTGQGKVSISQARVDKLHFGPIHAQARGDGDRIIGDLEIQQQLGGNLVAHAQLNRTGSQPLSARAQIKKLDVTFARLFTTGVREIAGLVDADVRVTGETTRPEVQGAVYYYNGRLGLVGQPTFHDMAVTLALKPGRVDIQKLQAYSGDGNLHGQGWITLDGTRPTGMVLTAKAHRFMLAAAGSTGARLDGDLALAAELRESVVSGKVEVPRASLWLPKVGPGGKKLQKIGQRDDIRFVDQAAKAAAEKALAKKSGEGAAQPRDLDIKATAGTVFVRAKDLDIELDSNLHLTDPPGGGSGVAINGLVQIRRGRINITGQRFDFEPSRIAFDGGTNPRLQIRITHQYPESLVAVEIRGTPEKPELKLSSDPPIYDQAQIISLVLTGQPGGEPSTGDSFDPTAAIASAVLGKLADKIAPELGLDVLRVETVKQATREAATPGASDTRIEVGKYISDRVYLSYAHLFGGSETQNRNEAHVEYRITRRWLLETVFGDAGVGGVDALWTYRY